MNLLEQLQARVIAQVPGVETKIEAPLRENGVWWLDVKLREQTLAIEWSRWQGFGVSSLPSQGLGEKPDETYTELEQATARVLELLREGKRTVLHA